MKILSMSGGLGPPPKDPSAFYVNVSRLISAGNCEYDYKVRYADNLTIGNRAFNAFDFGTTVHDILEHFETVDDDRDAKIQILFNSAITLEQRIINSDSEREIEDIKACMRWLEFAMVAYIDKYPADPDCEVLSTEQPCWLRVRYQADDYLESTVVFMGRLDRVLLVDGEYLMHGQIKTMSTRWSLPTYLEQQTQSLHEALYCEALSQEDSFEGKIPVTGTRFDLLRKELAPEPPKTSYTKQNGTVVNRSEEWLEKQGVKYQEKLGTWADHNLVRSDLMFSVSKRRAMIEAVLPAVDRARSLASGIDSPIKNKLACLSNNAGRPCTLFDHCYRGAPLAELLVERTPDYVDAARQEAAG